MKNFMKSIFITIFSFTLLLLSGCNKTDVSSSSDVNSEQPFTIIAGSELKDMDSILKKAENELHFPIKVSYTGTIDGVEQVKQGLAVDAAWFSQSKYFYDTAENAKRIKLSEKTMLSPVVVGIRQNSFKKLTIKDINNITWSDIASWVNNNKFTYAMTDPSASNTGYVALMGVAYATAGTGENLKASDVNTQKMKSFFTGHKLNAGSSAWLMEAFAKSDVDFVVNYESVILQYNKANPQDQLKVIYPNEGIVTSDYPLLLLNSKKTEQYKRLVDYLKSQSVQQEIMQTTSRRPIAASVMMAQQVFNKDQLLIEMPFTPDNSVADQLLSAYYDEYKKPAAVVFVLDTSGSMQGEREVQMKQAISSLTVSSSSDTKYAKLRPREKVWIVPFSSDIYGVKKFELNGNINSINKSINDYVQSLQMDGGTALFSAAAQAVNILKQEMSVNSDYRFSVVVLTDGQVNQGINLEQFQQFMQQSNLKQGDIRIYPVLFGDAKNDELQAMAQASGGKIFDGKNKGLAAVFKEIRSYQ